VAHGHVHEAFQFGESDDLGQDVADRAIGEAQERAVEVNVFDPRQVG